MNVDVHKWRLELYAHQIGSSLLIHCHICSFNIYHIPFHLFLDTIFNAFIENNLLDMSSPTTCDEVEPDTA